jgi:hypothetical protein
MKRRLPSRLRELSVADKRMSRIVRHRARAARWRFVEVTICDWNPTRYAVWSKVGWSDVSVSSKRRSCANERTEQRKTTRVVCGPCRRIAVHIALIPGRATIITIPCCSACPQRVASHPFRRRKSRAAFWQSGHFCRRSAGGEQVEKGDMRSSPAWVRRDQTIN